jgi:DNA-binding beta-propeller fold protein YncE
MHIRALVLVAAAGLAACSTSQPSLVPVPAASGAAKAAAHRLFVSNDLNNTIAVLDASTGAPVAVISGGGLNCPVGMAVGPAGKTFAFPILYVANSCNSTISSFNALTYKAVMKPVPLTGLNHPRGMAYAAPFIFIANDGNSTIEVTDPTCGKGGCFSMPSIIHSGGLDTPQGLKIAGGLIYTANAANDSLSIFNQQSWAPVAVVTQGSLATPEGIAVAGGTIFVANAGSNDIATYDAKTRKPSGRITGNGLAEPLGMDQGGGVLFVVDHDTNRISRFSVSTQRAMGTLAAPSLDGPVDVLYY